MMHWMKNSRRQCATNSECHPKPRKPSRQRRLRNDSERIYFLALPGRKFLPQSINLAICGL